MAVGAKATGSRAAPSISSWQYAQASTAQLDLAREMIAATMSFRPRPAAVIAWLAMTTTVWAGPSVYVTAPDDPKAITVKATGDGIADDSAAIQQALDA